MHKHKSTNAKLNHKIVVNMNGDDHKKKIESKIIII